MFEADWTSFGGKTKESETYGKRRKGWMPGLGRGGLRRGVTNRFVPSRLRCEGAPGVQSERLREAREQIPAEEEEGRKK